MTQDTIRRPPAYCGYASGPCDQDFDSVTDSGGLFLYSSEPRQIAATIETAVRNLCQKDSSRKWLTWRELSIVGQIIFCQICKAMRFTDHVIVDVTTLNFNLMFEIGFALGLELPVMPIRDTSFARDRSDFLELGILDTIGYSDFQNNEQISDGVLARVPSEAIPAPRAEIDFAAPLYVLKGPLNTEGEIRLLSTLKKSVVHFRTFDVVETPRLSLHEIRKRVASSLAVIVHLLSRDREGARVHNARCALIAGIAMAAGKAVLMLQEGEVQQPIDYRDVVADYLNPDRVPLLVKPILMRIITSLQDTTLRSVRPPAKLLQRLDVGDLAAENEIRPLRSYFVETGQYNQAKRGYARLVVGRKGSGKTAVFYAIRDSLGRGHSLIVLDLKPEGHQFTKLREVVLSKLSPGLQEHTLTAFWNSILLAELAHKITKNEYSWAHRDPERINRYEKVQEAYEAFGYAQEGDFSERLLYQVDRLAVESERRGDNGDTSRMTEALYLGDIRVLDDAVGEYLEEKREAWLLVDNLDKGWPTRGASNEDILILRTLMEATRKIQRQLEKRNVNFHCLVFVRNDIYDHLILETPDKGKDTAITLDWSDTELFKEIFRSRIVASGLLDGTFEQVWATVLDPSIGTRDSFSYTIERTLKRPRDFLTFIHRAIEIAVNRGHERVLQDDLKQAEVVYSQDMLQTTAFELKDVFPGVGDFLYAFLECKTQLDKSEVLALLREADVPNERAEEVLALLSWFGFLGVLQTGTDEPRYAYEMRYDMKKLLAPVEQGKAKFFIHPAFHSALECTSQG